MSHISIVVPTHNSQETVESCLISIEQSTYKDFEIILIDDASKDNTCAIASQYPLKLIKHEKNLGPVEARNTGFRMAKGDIVVNIDSDVMIKSNTLTKIDEYFQNNPSVSALTGLLSKEHPHSNYFSQYKNLYMNYIFKQLPEKVNFLYGSIFAIRQSAIELNISPTYYGEDAVLGQKIISSGKSISFLKDLEVVHQKKYDFFSFVKNDFLIPFHWVNIFLTYKGWKAIGKFGSGYLHSPREQLASVALMPILFSLAILNFFSSYFTGILISLFLVWILLNARFIYFFIKEKGFIFGIIAFFVTLMDNAVMALGIICGFIVTFMQWMKGLINQ